MSVGSQGTRRGRRILLINQHYWPDHASTAQHLTDLAEALVEQGHEVHVICSRAGSRPGSPPRLRREVRHGVAIQRVGATGFGRASTLRRMADYVSFHLLALIAALRLPRFDVVVTLTTPPLIAIVGCLLRRLRGTRHILWSMDLHPDASLALGRMTIRNPLHRALAALSDALYREADRVVALGHYMAERVARKGVRPERIATIPVWSRRDEVYPLPRLGHPLREALGLEGSFVVMYSGNHGLAHTFDALLDAARRLRDRPDIVFLFVGDGPRRTEVTLAREGGRLTNVRLLDFFPREHLFASLSLADLHVVSLRPEMVGICVPGKLYGAMASGRPVLFVGPPRCEVADTVREHGCGEVVSPHDGATVARIIERLADDPERAERLGEAGLAAFLQFYEREPCCAAWCWLIEELWDDTCSPLETPQTAAITRPDRASHMRIET
ncbi:MAG: glycosyltransferase WbuB [Isosphaeraceae bacterium]|jgi:glycosyltransferase involved in cell wall biosynthesis|nr:MAG: glycosyltransferase WbuB [Isosphaeraceae bacterium]